MGDTINRAFDSIKSFHGTSQDNSCDWCDRAEIISDAFYANDADRLSHKLCREYDPQMSAIDKTIKLVGGLREELKEKLLPLNVHTPEQFMTQSKNLESSEKVMTHHRKRIGSMPLPEPTYRFELNDYSMVVASQPREQFNPTYYQQPYQTHSEKFNYSLNRRVKNHQQQTRNCTFSYQQ
ncbi:unnamed protein product [Rotaria magnacalcarata]|uniref:Uncharacterized protein n=3 Tax=Rotaria magnacalcarata TaxID=392030 RepID=A0A816SUS3_9BILA|nr:unnamed protein product [Rotaria magnacalcarata]CAF2089971.1 unnamed protein product [Rotaria magnacalcarata]CAF3946443.1 unnamed protein product [Rotaria magnacalcarata]